MLRVKEYLDQSNMKEKVKELADSYQGNLSDGYDLPVRSGFTSAINRVDGMYKTLKAQCYYVYGKRFDTTDKCRLNITDKYRFKQKSIREQNNLRLLLNTIAVIHGGGLKKDPESGRQFSFNSTTLGGGVNE